MANTQVTFCQEPGVVPEDDSASQPKAGDDNPVGQPGETPRPAGTSAWPVRDTIRPPGHPYWEGLPKT